MMEDKGYISIRELEEDLRIMTGNAGFAKMQAEHFAIYYRNEIISATRYKRNQLSAKELVYSRHIRWQHAKRHSHQLNENMLAANKGPRPANTSAHHIVAWNDMRAATARMRLAAFGIDIDHAANGVYLPSFSKNTPMNRMPSAIAHSKTHTNIYYLNVEHLLQETIGENLGRNGIIETLEEIAEDLQSGDFPLTTLIS